jgi:HSP20 family protein
MYPDDLFREFDRLFAELSASAGSHARRGSFNPNTDVYITNGGRSICVQIELAGVDADNIKLVVEGRTLYLAGVRGSEAHGAEAVMQKEIEHGYFFKKIQLPMQVELARASAEYSSGMLTVKLPVAEPSSVLVPDRTEIRMVVRSRS